jgi:hypothetical protein
MASSVALFPGPAAAVASIRPRTSTGSIPPRFLAEALRQNSHTVPVNSGNGSLLVASRSLGMSTSTAGRRLDALATAAGCRLVHRSQAGTYLAPAAMHLVRLAEATI